MAGSRDVVVQSEPCSWVGLCLHLATPGNYLSQQSRPFDNGLKDGCGLR